MSDDSKKALSLQVSPEATRLLDSLASHGLFGGTRAEVAERLLAEKLREVVREGWVGVTGYPDGRTAPLITR